MSKAYVKIIDCKKDRPAWLRARNLGLGASDAATVMGMSPYESRYTLFMQRSGSMPKQTHSSFNEDDNEAMSWGRDLEPIVARRYGERSGRRIKRGLGGWLLQSLQWPWMCATPDFEEKAPGRRTWGNLECKTTNEYSGDEWKVGAEGTVTGIDSNGFKAAVPERYWCQLQHQLAVMGRRYGSVCCLIGGQRLAWAHFERDDKFIKELVLQTKAFWEMLQHGVVPDPDNHPSTWDTLRKLKEDGRVIDLPRQALQLWGEMEAFSATKTEAETNYKLRKAELGALLGTASYGLMPDGRGVARFVTTHRKGYSVEPTSYRELTLSRKIDRKLLRPEDRPDRPPLPAPDPALVGEGAG